jgi:hypothetical protein
MMTEINKLVLREKDTMALATPGMIDRVVYSLSKSKSIDDEGTEFAVFTLDLADAITYLEQVSLFLRKQNED